MEAKELRIGNWVIYKNEIIKVDSGWIVHQDYWLKHKEKTNNDVDNKVLHPIPLTEEWLLRFGFNKSDYFDHCYESSNFQIVKSENSIWWVCRDGVWIVPLPYVHTLQNFFALTGEELKFKE